jgi:hypothetical protein
MNIDTNKFRSVSILADGNCQFRSISYCLYKTENEYSIIKSNIIKYIVENKDLFSNYIYDMTFEEYIENISEENEWGNEVTLLAASLCLEIEINVYDKESNKKISTYNELPVDNIDKKIYLYYDNLIQHYEAIRIASSDEKENEYVDEENIIKRINNLKINKLSINNLESVDIITDKYNLYRAVAYCLCKREHLYTEVIKRIYRCLINNEEMINDFITKKGAEYISNNGHIIDYLINDISYEELIKGFAEYKILPDNNILKLISLNMKINISVYNKDTKELIKKYNILSGKGLKSIYLYYDEVTTYYDAIEFGIN